MSSSARRIVIEFLGDDKSASKTARSVDSSTSKLGATFAKVGKMAALGLAAGIGLAAAGMVSAVKAAEADQASASKLATALQNVTGATDAQIASVESYILKMSLATGVADDELRPAFQRLVTATGDVGKAQDLMTLAMDVSAGTGKSLESVTTALAKAQNGSVSGLARLGIATKNAAGETMTFEQIQRKLTDSFGGQAAAKADTFQGKIARLKVAFEEAKETIGYALIPVLTQLIDVFMTRAVPAIQRTAQWINANLVPGLKAMGSWMRDNAVAVGAFVAAIGAAIVAFKVYAGVTKVIAALQAAQAVAAGVATEAQIGLNAAMRANAIGLAVVAIAALVAGLVIAYKKSETFRKIVDGAFKAVSKAARVGMAVMRDVVSKGVAVVRALWQRFGGTITDVFQKAASTIASVARSFLRILTGLFKVFSGALRGDWREVWSGVKDILKGAWQAIRDITKGSLGIMRDLLRAAVGAWRDILRGAASVMRDILRSAWDAMKSAARDFVATMRGVIRDGFSAMRDIVRDGAGAIVDAVRAIPSKLAGLVGSFANAGSSLIHAVFDGIASAASSAGGFVSSLAGQLISAVRSAINSALGLPLSVDFDKGPIHIHATVIPALAKGGIVTKPTLAMIGEAGPEAIIPLTGARRATAGAYAGEQVVHVHVYLDGKELQQSLLRQKRLNGGRELGLA